MDNTKNNKKRGLSVGVFIAIFVVVYASLSSNQDSKTENNTNSQTGSNTVFSGQIFELSYQGESAETPTDARVDDMSNWEIITSDLDAPRSIIEGDDNHIILTERGGNIIDVDISNGDKKVLKTLPAEQNKGSAEAGLLGIVKDDKNVYAAYTYRKDGKYTNRLVAMNYENGQLGEEKILLDNIPGSSNHDGGAVEIGPDDTLYRTIGDAGDDKSAQNTGVFNGKILRINKDGSIPTDNPRKDSYIRSYGHRNPQGLTRQPGTNFLRSTEHGPSSFTDCCRDEINLIISGANYGWPNIRGKDTQKGMVTPMRISGGDETRAPAGITFVKTGAWQGNLLIAGLRGEALYRVIFDKDNPTKITKVERYLKNKLGRIRDVLSTNDGYIYIITNNTDGRGSPKAGDDKLRKTQMNLR